MTTLITTFDSTIRVAPDGSARIAMPAGDDLDLTPDQARESRFADGDPVRVRLRRTAADEIEVDLMPL